MRVLGISGRSSRAAAALVVDGCLVAAVTEQSVSRIDPFGPAHSAALPFGAVRGCLKHAGLSPAAIDVVVVEDGTEADVAATREGWQAAADLRGLGSGPHMMIDRLTARAAQALAVVGSSRSRVAVLDLEGAGCGGVFQIEAGQLSRVSIVSGMGELAGSVSEIARQLGSMDDDLAPIRALAAIGRPRYLPELRRAIEYREGVVAAVAAELAEVITTAQADAPGPLADAAPLHVAVKEARAGLASSLIARLGEVAGDVVADADAGEGVIVSGDLFESAAIVAAVHARVPQVRVAPLPGRFGPAVGAAIFGAGPVAMRLPSGLAIGPAFTEQDVKEVLDGCRLDYVYEPDWPRLLPRVSRLLTRGKLVAWFQGAMDFGPRSLGGRSILCDPANRYARENINRYLRHRPDDQPPALVMLAERTGDCLADAVDSPFRLTTATVKPEWRPRLQAAVDGAGSCRVHTVAAGSGRLADLLAVHESRSGSPALVHADLRGLGEPTACSPRDAIRTTFSSPVDALVIERFLLMKDYWLLRSATEMTA